MAIGVLADARDGLRGKHLAQVLMHKVRCAAQHGKHRDHEDNQHHAVEPLRRESGDNLVRDADPRLLLVELSRELIK